MRRGACILALGLAACGEPGARVSVALSVGASCAGASLDAITIPCDSVVGVWLLDPAGDALDSACVEYSDGPATLGLLPEALSSAVEFAGVTAEQVQLELAVYSPATSGCPRYRPLALPQPEVFARSALVELARAERIDLELACLGFDFPAPGTDCAAQCEDDRVTCEAEFEGRYSMCLSNDEQCRLACGDMPVCLAFCDQALEACLQGLPDCAAERDGCLAGCTDSSGC